MDVCWVLFLPSNSPWKPSYFFVLTKCSLISCCPLSYLKLGLFFPNFGGKKTVFRVFSQSFLFSSPESLHFCILYTSDSGRSSLGLGFFFLSGKDGLSPHMCAGLDSQISLACHEADTSFLGAPLSSQTAVTFLANQFRKHLCAKQ